MNEPNELSYVLITPYTIAKSRTGGVLARLLSRADLELAGAQMIIPNETFAMNYAQLLRKENVKDDLTLLADYVEQNFISGGRPHRILLLLFRGPDACRKLSDICGALYAEHRGIESLTGETIRDTYADLIFDNGDPNKVSYFEPAVLTPRNQRDANRDLALIAHFLKGRENLVANVEYPDPSKIEQTLVILKPDNWNYASSKPGTIIDMFSRTGMRIVGIKVHQFTQEEALHFYGPVEAVLKEKLAPVFGGKAAEILEKEFSVTLSDDTKKILTESFGKEYAQSQFRDIIEFMSGERPGSEKNNKPVKTLILIYEGEGAVKKIREVLGPTDPLKAPGGTVRREFGSNIMVNTAHASDSTESFEREQAIVKIRENTLQDIIGEFLGQRT
ncbi:MAG: nucleoside-diphosphate kinase [Spirochaetaceae bacterium]|jgi:nucleoside diphosphate kinase|nr:nucleoside-diphosphate kinase [Spirochaetaceae bacterium]